MFYVVSVAEDAYHEVLLKEMDEDIFIIIVEVWNAQIIENPSNAM